MRGVVLQHWERLSRCAFRRASNQAISAFCRNPMCDLALSLGRPSWQASKGSTTKATSAAKNADQQRILTVTTCIYIVDVDSDYIKTLKGERWLRRLTTTIRRFTLRCLWRRKLGDDRAWPAARSLLEGSAGQPRDVPGRTPAVDRNGMNAHLHRQCRGQAIEVSRHC